MNYINVLLLTLFTAPYLNGMQPNNSSETTPCNLFRSYEIKPHERLEIVLVTGALQIVTPQPNAGFLEQIYAAFASSVNTRKQPPVDTIYILSLMEIINRTQEPYTITRKENIVRIEERAELKKLGITLKGLVITLPSNIPKDTISIGSNQKLKNLAAAQEE